jgi:hypothetical protein
VLVRGCWALGYLMGAGGLIDRGALMGAGDVIDRGALMGRGPLMDRGPLTERGPLKGARGWHEPWWSRKRHLKLNSAD